MKYQVWSLNDGVEVLEVTRTSKSVALEDVSIIYSILGRKAWVKEV